MSFPNFPGALWDGSSADRSLALDKETALQVRRAPSPDDYSQITAEIQSMQIQLGAGGISGTTATKGFHFIPSVAGAPTGVPVGVPAGFVAMAYDYVDHKIYVYDGGWKATAALA